MEETTRENVLLAQSMETPRRSKRILTAINYKLLNTGQKEMANKGDANEESSGMTDFTVSAPEFDNEIDISRNAGARPKTPSAQQIPSGTVSNTVKSLDPTSNSKGNKKNKKGPSLIVLPSDDELAQMDDKAFQQFKEQQEKKMEDSIRAQMLETRKNELKLLQKAQQVAFAEVQEREKELQSDWKSFEQIRDEIRTESQTGRNQRQNQYSNILQSLRKNELESAFSSNRFNANSTQVQHNRNHQLGACAGDNRTENALYERSALNTIQSENTMRSYDNATTATKNNLSVTFSGQEGDVRSVRTFARGRGIRRPEQNMTGLNRMPANRQFSRDDELVSDPNRIIQDRIELGERDMMGGETGYSDTTPQHNDRNQFNFPQNNTLSTPLGNMNIHNDQQMGNMSNTQFQTLSNQANTMVENRRLDAEFQSDPVRNLQDMGLWRNPGLMEDSTYNLIDPSTPGTRGRSRERRTPPFGTSRRRDNYPRGRNYSGGSQNHSPKNKSKSGINDTAESFAKEKLIWPQKQLGFRYLQNQPSFDQLQFEHLVLGELCTISSTDSSFEASNRLRLLKRIAYWKMKGAAWFQIRNFYAAFISGVEAHELDWNDSFTELENMIIDRPSAKELVKFDRKPKYVKKEELPWFCKKFNSETGCTLESGHMVTTQKGDLKPALHICAKCLRLKRVRKEHSETSKDCPEKQ